MKKFQSLGKSLSKQQQKNVVGGLEDEGGGGGGVCTGCWCDDNGYHSCWYSSNPWGLCQRVYPNCSSLSVLIGGCWGGDSCTMN